MKTIGRVKSGACTMMPFVGLQFVLIIASFQLVYTHVNEYFYSIELDSVYGEKIPLETYKNQVLLFVNVASECGYTDDHYRGLVSLQKRFGDTGVFQVLAFPCNQFGGQEPKDIDDILRFVTDKYNINFPLFNKVDVAGKNAAPVWKYIQDTSGVAPSWNYFKYLVDHEGRVRGSWGPQTGVAELVPVIEEAVTAAQNAFQTEIHRDVNDL